jgi:outer membrane biosynthesis protein TonB
MSETPDPQRTREQDALRNVRGTLDEIAEKERREKSSLVRVLLIVVLVLAIGTAAAFWVHDALRKKPDAAQLAKSRATVQAAAKAAELSRASYLAGPKRSYVGATTEPRFAGYAENCLARVENLANTKYKSEVAALDGEAKVSMAIRYDGMIEAVDVQSWSGHNAVEPAAKRLVRMAEPCGEFPDDVRRDTDVLHVATTVTFAKQANGQVVLAVDRPWKKQ